MSRKKQQPSVVEGIRPAGREAAGMDALVSVGSGERLRRVRPPGVGEPGGKPSAVAAGRGAKPPLAPPGGATPQAAQTPNPFTDRAWFGRVLSQALSLNESSEDMKNLYQQEMDRQALIEAARQDAQRRMEAETPPQQGEAPPSSEPAPKPKRPRRVLRFILKFAGVLLVFVVSLAALLYGAAYVVCTGPFPTAREMFVVSVTETSALKFVPFLFFTEGEVAEILQKNTVVAPDEVTDPTVPFEPPAPSEEVKDIEIIEVSGSTFKGKLMVIADPARVRLATISAFGPEVSGRRVEDLVADQGAVAGINAGGFLDEGGVGKGGQPLGLLIRDGKILSGSPSTWCNVIGLSWDHRLIVGEMTGQDALDMGVRDAVYFEPTLVVNGKAAEVAGNGGGVNPRTVIGQRADGAILFLVIDGRQPHSIGATLQDCIALMLEHGAVNAANLDGGSSSMMVYEGEVINVCASLYGSRTQPAAFVVDPLDNIKNNENTGE